MHKDGMAASFLRDDLEAIRERYGSGGQKKRMLGFAGNKNIAQRVDKLRLMDESSPPGTVVHHLTSDTRSDEAIPPGEYLRWLSECFALLHLPGDTWKCSRHMEAVMMGVPVVLMPDPFDITPPLHPGNSICVKGWDDWWTVNDVFEFGDTLKIIGQADADYRLGWSLRGQLQQILRRLGK
jgi:hypothetical protein